MMDALYLLLTVGFFAAMLGYSRGCEALGRDPAKSSEDA